MGYVFILWVVYVAGTNNINGYFHSINFSIFALIFHSVMESYSYVITSNNFKLQVETASPDLNEISSLCHNSSLRDLRYATYNFHSAITWSIFAVKCITIRRLNIKWIVLNIMQAWNRQNYRTDQNCTILNLI